MPEYIADTNVYIMAANDEKFRSRFASFIRTHGPLLVSAVVAGEFLIGIADASRHIRAIEALRGGSDSRRTEPPTIGSWPAPQSPDSEEARYTKGRSFWNDALLAAQCSRLGATLITSNQADFKRLRTFTRVRAVAPFPP